MSMGNRMPPAGGWLVIVLVGLSLMFLLMELGNIYGN